MSVKKADGTIIDDVPAATDWVEANFKPEVLAAVQKTIFEALSRVEIISLDDKKDWHSERGFINVEDANVKVMIENDAINALKYHPPKRC